MKKCVLFLINGLGIEKPGSYRISLNETMPQLMKLQETSYYTSATVNSLEPKSAYQDFYLGDTFKHEMGYIEKQFLNDSVKDLPVFQSLSQKVVEENTKLHIFLEPTTERIADQINNLVTRIPMSKNKKIYLHLLLTQQTTQDYRNLIEIIKYIKYHISSNITVGFIIGKEYISLEPSTDELKTLKKLFFYCSAERWSETDKKLTSLKESNIRPCVAPGFCSTTECAITNGDTIMFYNIKRANYDNLIKILLTSAEEVFKEQPVSLPIFSLLKLDSNYQIPYFIENIYYDNSLSEQLKRINKKALIVASRDDINYINFLANGYNHATNPNIQFMDNNPALYTQKQTLENIIDNTDYELIIFDYHMDTTKTINDLKIQLAALDKIVGYIGEICVNKHSLFITSLYGLKKSLPLAEYNTELVTINYEMQIPIFFFDYSYPRSKYALKPGYPNDILQTALKCLAPEMDCYTLLRTKGLLNNLFKK